MNCYESIKLVNEFDLLVAEDSDFDLTQDRVYVARSKGYGNLVQVVNDKGILEQYSLEYFRFYEGERIGF